MIVPLQASEGGSRSQEEEEEEESSDAALDDEVNSKEISCAFQGGVFTKLVVPGLVVGLSSDGIVGRIGVLNIQVDQKESGKSSQNKTKDEDSLGQVITRSGLENVSVGSVLVGSSGSPDNDSNGGEEEGSGRCDEDDVETGIKSGNMDAGEDQGGDGSNDSSIAQVSGPENVVATFLAVEEIVFFKVFSLFIMSKALTEVLAGS